MCVRSESFKNAGCIPALLLAITWNFGKTLMTVLVTGSFMDAIFTQY